MEDRSVDNREWKKGSAELLLLSLLEAMPRHGYDLGKLIEQRSHGALLLLSLIHIFSASRAGASFKSASCSRICSFQSGIFDSRDAVDGLDKYLPALTLGSQHLASLRGEPVIAPPPLAALLHPAALDPAALFQTVQQRI